jgi:Uma2 family endonuclease
MVTNPVSPTAIAPPATPASNAPTSDDPLREDYEANPLPVDCFDQVPEGMELVNGDLVEKAGITLKHAGLQNALGAEWRSYSRASQQGGKTYTEGLCQTQTQKRRPDVAYVTQNLLDAHGEPTTFPQAFPLIAEVASPDDSAEMLFQKAQEYLDSGSEEVWILLPETRLAFIVLRDRLLAFTAHQTLSTQVVLPGFSIELAALFE